MRHVRQEGERGCGPATVAMLAGITLAEAKLLFKGGGGNSGLQDVRKALEEQGFSVAILHSGVFCNSTRKEKQQMVEGAESDLLLKVNRKDGNVGHWMAWDSRKQRLLDPYSKDKDKPCFKISDVDRIYKVTEGR